ncbi:MAG: ATP-binding protein [Kiritimatiellae bacterium]|nr:ATP-binding protein [Kiritimatiellia bacterium]
MVPFKSGMVVVGANFCGRNTEIVKLKAHIERCSRVCLVGERRIGKTSLVHETVRRLRGRVLIFVDLLGVKSSGDVVRRMVEGVFVSAPRSMLTRLAKSFVALRPVVGIDPLTNAPTLGLSPGVKPPPETLEEALDYMSRQKGAVVFFDEFQTLLDLPVSEQEDLVARMRSRIQMHAETPYVFAGSLRAEMDRIFFDHASPFYKAAVRFELGPLDRSAFGSFLRKSFADGRRSIADPLLVRIFDLCHDVPGDVQRLCQCLWDESRMGTKLEEPMLATALHRLFSDEERAYTILLEYVTGQQLKCLRALGEMGGGASLSGQLLALTGVAANSSVQRALNSLVKKRILFRQGKLYRFCDPFFGEWIRLKRL